MTGVMTVVGQVPRPRIVADISASGRPRCVVARLVERRRCGPPVAIGGRAVLAAQLVHHTTTLVLTDPLLVVLGTGRFPTMLHLEHENLLKLRS
jgi:hypothetical protein